jgi:hypothetical protein
MVTTVPSSARVLWKMTGVAAAAATQLLISPVLGHCRE